MNEDPLKSVRSYYMIADKPQMWILRCKKCRRGYELEKPKKGMHVGNILALLNHAYSHFPQHEDDDDDE